jgi:hypothetical protein
MRTTSQLEHLLGQVFDEAREGLRESLDPAEYEKRRQDFVFHMTDWKRDLEQLTHLFRNPDQSNEEAASTLVIGFLYHVLPHLNAAGRLLLDDVADPFTPAETGQKKK